MKKSVGMTFIEVLIAIVIVGIVLPGMLTSLNFASKYARHNANKTMALNYAQGLMEEIKNVSYADLDDYVVYPPTVLLYQQEGVNIVATRSAELEEEDEGEEPDDDSEAFTKIKVTVSWDWLGRSYTEEVNTLRYNYE